MKAAIFRGAGKPLTVEEYPKPEAGHGEVVVRVAACGVCHTDLHYVDHGTPTFKPVPMILGHEISGWVDGIGPGVTEVKREQAVLIPAVLTCGACVMCQQGRSNVCARMTMLGNHIDGGFAEYVKVPARDLVPLPGEIDVTEASIVADAVTTGYHAAVRRAELRPGDKVAVFGCGGVGLSTMQFAAIAGAHVIAVDVDEKKLSIAKELGAADVVNAAVEKEVAKTLRKMTGGGVDRAIECIGKPVTIQQGHMALRVGGRLVIVGYCDKTVEMTVAKVMFQEQEVIGSLGCRPGDFPRVVELVRSGKFRLSPLITARRPLSEVGLAMDDLRAGRSVRTVITPGP